jgi:hypothetical protein
MYQKKSPRTLRLRARQYFWKVSRRDAEDLKLCIKKILRDLCASARDNILGRSRAEELGEFFASFSQFSLELITATFHAAKISLGVAVPV